MNSFVVSLLLSFLVASATSSSLKVAEDRETCEAECMAEEGNNPVCAVNGMEFPNRCTAESCAATTVGCTGPCPCTAEMSNCNCPKDKKPVCGFGGQTYDNECLMKCA